MGLQKWYEHWKISSSCNHVKNWKTTIYKYIYILNSDISVGHYHIFSSQEYNFVRFLTRTLVIALWLSLYFCPDFKVFRKQTRVLKALIICNVHCVLVCFFCHLEQRIINPYRSHCLLLSFSADSLGQITKKPTFLVFSF